MGRDLGEVVRREPEWRGIRNPGQQHAPLSRDPRQLTETALEVRPVMHVRAPPSPHRRRPSPGEAPPPIPGDRAPPLGDVAGSSRRMAQPQPPFGRAVRMSPPRRRCLPHGRRLRVPRRWPKRSGDPADGTPRSYVQCVSYSAMRPPLESRLQCRPFLRHSHPALPVPVMAGGRAITRSSCDHPEC